MELVKHSGGKNCMQTCRAQNDIFKIGVCMRQLKPVTSFTLSFSMISEGGVSPICREKLLKILESQPWGKKSKRYFYSRNEEYVNALRAGLGLW